MWRSACIWSDYLKQGFIKDLPGDRLASDISAKCHVIGNELTRVAKKRPGKKKTIILAGRMVAEKGILEACQAAARILPEFPDWHLHIVGGRHFQKSALSAYEQSVQDALRTLSLVRASWFDSYGGAYVRLRPDYHR
ncbi:MAG: glycosyltransferase [Proteobacteria bacterium]|nr:glycosyltransferase [Pseudomonadota bacterium]